jgi:hypothetical protein
MCRAVILISLGFTVGGAVMWGLMSVHHEMEMFESKTEHAYYQARDLNYFRENHSEDLYCHKKFTTYQSILIFEVVINSNKIVHKLKPRLLGLAREGTLKFKESISNESKNLSCGATDILIDTYIEEYGL